MIFHYPISSLPGIDGDEDRFFRGLTCIGEYVCCGSSSGNILVFNCGSISKSSDFSLVHNLESESLIAITALSSSRSTLVAGNDEGKLFGYKVDEAFELGFTFDGTGFPCTSLQQGGNILYAAYASGHIRIFRTDIVELAIEIAAHARCITGLALHPKLNMLCSCALDQYVMVWSTPDFKSAATSNMTLIYSDSLENRLCTGVAYLSNDSICVSSYDDDELFVLTSK